MRGIYTPVTELRRKVYAAVAKMAWECEEVTNTRPGWNRSRMKLSRGEDARYRDSVFKERAILGERPASGDGPEPVSCGTARPRYPRISKRRRSTKSITNRSGAD